MLPLLPTEILDVIVDDHLHDNRDALKSCSLVSKSWVPRTRRHLFGQLEFRPRSCPIELWIKAFPDPCNSPAHYARILSLYGFDITPEMLDALTWIRSFRQIEKLQVTGCDSSAVPLAHLQGLSPTLKVIHLQDISIRLSALLDVICSFPLLEEIFLYSVTAWGATNGWTPPTFPKLARTLHLHHVIHPIARGLVDLPGGLHLTTLSTLYRGEESESIRELVLGCSDTLESLDISHYFSDPMSSLDLSHATELKEVEFRCSWVSIRWITETLRTAKSANLRSINITIHTESMLLNQVEETARSEWYQLDSLLDNLCASRAVRLNVKISRKGGADGAEEPIQSFLPNLARKEVISVSE